MEITDELKQELVDELSTIFGSDKKLFVDTFLRLPGGDAETYSFRLTLDKNCIPLILRVYRSISERAEEEYNTLKSLFDAEISVPEPILWKKNSTISRSYMIMKKIPGLLLAEYLFSNISDTEKKQLFYNFIEQAVKIHSFKWKNLSYSPKIPDFLSNSKNRIYKYDVNELKPLVKWLEENKVDSDESSLLHGDYHMNNVIATPEGKIVVIDWADIKIGDFRHDLGFAIVTASSAGEDLKDNFVKLY